MASRFIQANSKREAFDMAPDAAKLVKVNGGYMAFDSIDDYETWKRQK